MSDSAVDDAGRNEESSGSMEASERLARDVIA